MREVPEASDDSIVVPGAFQRPMFQNRMTQKELFGQFSDERIIDVR